MNKPITNKKEPLSVTHPDIARQWHPTKNGFLKPEDVSYGSNRKIWWKCGVADDHEWAASVYSRTHGYGCPFCSGHRATLSNSLFMTHPEVAKQWHPTKNGELTPKMVTAGSNRKVWWKCDTAGDHIYSQSIEAKALYGQGCPMCANKILVRSNSLAITYPEIAKQWHPTKNGSLTPWDVTFGTGKKVWWKCVKGGDHEWQAKVILRTKYGMKCPVCDGKMVGKSNCLATVYPVIAKQWHPKKNGSLTPYNVHSGSHKKVWWKCDQGQDHEWQAIIQSRTSRGLGCPICDGKKVVKSNCLAIVYPEIAEQWHPVKNGSLSPFDVYAGGKKRVWWKCDVGEDHEWKAPISERIDGHGCPMCAGVKVVKSNCLATTHPEIAKEWDLDLNGDLTPHQVTAGSGRSVYWKCSVNEEHIWKAKILNRTIKDSACPYCKLSPQSKTELGILFEMKLFFNGINTAGHKIKTRNGVYSADIYIKEINLVIEFDGSYWHKDRIELDVRKSRELINSGYDILRIRENPLDKINDNDIQVEIRPGIKSVVDKIINYILNSYRLSEQKTIQLYNYLSKDQLQNTNALNRHIEGVLKKKAEKKSD